MTKEEAIEYAAENIKLCHWYVNRIQNQFWASGSTYDDMVQAAYLGLVRAAKTWDPDKGKFSTYGFQWMRQAVQREASPFQWQVHVPVHAWAKAKVKEFSITDNTSGYRAMSDTSKDRISTLEEVIEDKKQTRLAEITESDIDFERYLTTLNPRLADVIIQRFKNDRTLAEIGQDYGITRERIRQIERVALRTCRQKEKEDAGGVRRPVVSQVGPDHYHYQRNTQKRWIMRNGKRMRTGSQAEESRA